MTLPAASLTVAAPASADWPRQGEWTYEDYRRLPDDGWRYEVIEGRLLVSPAPGSRHQRVIVNLVFLLKGFTLRHGGEVLVAPVDVLLPGGIAAPVQPDLVYLTEEHRARVTERGVEGAPDLVIEVLSPSNWVNDRRDKMRAYAVAGIPEYWIVDPVAETVEVYALVAGRYELIDRFERGGTVRSRLLPELAIAVDEIFAS